MPMNLGLGLGLSRRAVASGGGGNVAPVITGVPTISGTAAVGETLTFNPASVTGTPTPSRLWKLYRDGVEILETASSTYDVVGADQGRDLTVEQIETNVAGSDTATSLATAIPSLDPATLSPTAWFRPNDTTSALFTGSGIPAVSPSVGQTVGLHLDKSQAYGLGSERVTNGSLTGNTGWTSSQGATTVGSAGGIVMTGTPNSTIVTNAATTYTSGRIYRITFTISGYSAGAVYVQLSNGASAPAVASSNLTANGTYTIYLLSNGNTTLRFLSSGTTTLTIDDVSAREVLGNHAIQATAGSRPTLAQTGGGVENLTDDGGDSLNWTAPSGTYTVKYVDTAAAVTTLTSQSLSGTVDMLPISGLVEIIYINRALTSDEDAGLDNYLEDVANPS